MYIFRHKNVCSGKLKVDNGGGYVGNPILNINTIIYFIDNSMLFVDNYIFINKEGL